MKLGTSEEFFRPFVDEMKELEKEGIHINDIFYHVRLKISCIIAYAPARSFLKCIKGK
jgi:hypothetical protein